MKPLTNKTESKKKKRDEPPASPPESSKKGKVHAQRKFAQGSGCSTYTTLAAATLPPRSAKKLPTRAATLPKAPLITNRVPTTTQFLDFLCYGRKLIVPLKGSSLLPSSLHYLRDGSLATSSEASPPIPVPVIPPPAPLISPLKERKPSGEEAPKPPVKKEVETKVPDALRKKYHDQRVAKQKQSSVTKMAQKVKGKVMVRTRSAVSRDEMSKDEESAAVAAKAKKKPVPVIALRKQLQRSRKPLVGKALQRQRAGLRSGGKLPEPKIATKDLVQAKPKKAEQGIVKNTKGGVQKKSKSKPAAAVSSDDEPLFTRNSQVTKKKTKEEPLRLTRSKATENEGQVDKVITLSRPKRVSNAAPNKEPASADSSPERTKREEPEKKKRAIKDVKEKGPKEDDNEDAAVTRRATRSTPAVESRPKKVAVIRELIQKKKQLSLNTLKRLKKGVFTPSVTDEKKHVDKINSSAAKEDKDGGVADEKSEKEDVASSSRTLRRKTLDTPESSKRKDLAPKKSEISVKSTKKANEKSSEPCTKADDSKENSRGSKRPVRKCSTHDKMWIDVDGFTSDEDDFIDMGSIVAGSLNAIDDTKKNAEKDEKPNIKVTVVKSDADKEPTTSSQLLNVKSNGTKPEEPPMKEKVEEKPSLSEKAPKDEKSLVKNGKGRVEKTVVCEDKKKATLEAKVNEGVSEKANFVKPVVEKIVSLAIATPKSEVLDVKKDAIPKTLPLTSPMMNPVLFPRTAAYLKLHESKDAERNLLKMEEVGVVRPKTATKTSPSAHLSSDGSHSLISRLAINNAAMAKPSVKVEPKKIVSERQPTALSETIPQKEMASVAEVKPNLSDINRESSERSESRYSTKMPSSSRKSGSESEKRKIPIDSSEDSESSDEKVARRKKTRRPSPRAEVVTRKERPKRQCSTMGKSWIERDSDDSTFYGDEEDVMELIRRSEMDIKRRDRKSQLDGSSVGNNEKKGGEAFSDSDDEPLLKKTMFAPSPSSFLTTDTPLSKSRCDSVPLESVSLAASASASVPAPTVTFHAVPREPINTAGLDLLSEVADKSTDRIEEWLNRNSFAFNDGESHRAPLPPSVANANIPDPVLQFVRSPPKPVLPNVPVKKVIPKVEPVLKRPPVSSVTDLIKLQRERKGSPKPVQEHHSKNCKCNSCVVKKGWFKNKPSPDEPKSVAKESPEKQVPAFKDASTEQSPPKASVSVAPMVQNVEVSVSTDTKITSPRKLSFLERMREREKREALVKPQLPPFSPSNESSVYAFEPELMRSTPAKASSQRSTGTGTSTNHASKQTESTSPSQSHQSTSIAVQVNMDTGTETIEATVVDDSRSFEMSTQTEGGEDRSPMFYIPLQTGTTVTSQQAVIQGVTLKLGTEGRAGHNQTLVMQAQLVTKPPSPSTTIKNVVMPQKKESKMTPPVGTVQPTTRKPPAASPRPRASVSPSSSKSSQSGAKKRGSTPLRGKSPLTAPKTTKALPSASTAKQSQSPLIMEAPTFHLTEKDFSDPLEFFDRIRPAAERYGICRIVPPSSFKPDCKVADDMRFTAYNQYVHRMFHRWGPSARQTMAMKKYLKTQRISLKPPPCVGGVEIDLPRLYQAVQTCGGLMKVMDKQKWPQVADLLRLPKAVHERVTKLDSIYCQYLLPYETLKDEERDKLMDEVDAEWAAHEEKIGEESSEAEEDEEDENEVEECEECIVKGKSMALNQFYRIARNTMSMWFKSAEPDAKEVEAEYWRLVTERNHHVCVHSGSIDSSGGGYGFPVGKNQFAKHPWNLKVLTNNCGSVLRSLGPVMGLTVPTLTVGMVFAAFCWYRDPHGLPWVEYLHTGAPKIWYGISDCNSALFRETLTKLMPKYIKEQRIWLPCDTAMVPPQRLAELGIPLSRTTQHPGQFVLVFPRAFTSSLCTGYLVSEVVYFARPSWLQTAEDAFREIHESAESTMFSLDNLLLSIATDNRASLELLKLVVPMVQRLRDREQTGRAALRDLGVKEEPLLKDKSRKKGGRSQEPEPEHECETCRKTLFLSMVSISAEEAVFCLQHGLDHLTSHRDHLPGAKLLFTHEQVAIDEVVEKLEERISAKESKSKKA